MLQSRFVFIVIVVVVVVVVEDRWVDRISVVGR